MNRWLEVGRQVRGQFGSPGTSGRTNDHGALSRLVPGSMGKPLSWEGAGGELNLPCKWDGRTLPGWQLLRIPWDHTAQGQAPPGARGQEGLQDWK